MNKKDIIILVILLAVLFGMIGFATLMFKVNKKEGKTETIKVEKVEDKKEDKEKKSDSKEKTNSKIIEVESQAEFEKILKETDKPILVDFYATWCKACKVMEPVVEEIAEEGYKVIKVNVDKKEFSQIIKDAKVFALPTFGVYKDGKLKDTTIGVNKKEVLIEFINK